VVSAEPSETVGEMDRGELRGIAFVLAAIVRYGQPELARQIADSLDLDYVQLAPVADETDLRDLRDALAR
jgi:hypothetical protein